MVLLACRLDSCGRTCPARWVAVDRGHDERGDVVPVRARPQVAWRPHNRSTGAHSTTAVGHRSGALRLAVAATLVAGLLLGSAMPTDAVPPPPENPSDGQIQQSQNDAAASAAEVGRLAGLVAQTEGEIQRLQNDMEMKAELANKARVDLSVAESDATAAASAAQHARDEVTLADQAVTDAKDKAAAFAAASFRQGSVLGSLSAYWDAGSAGDILQRQELLGQMSGSQLNAMSNLEATRTHKANLDSAARASADAANAAQAKADQAKTAAVQAQQEAADALQSGQDQLASLQAQHDQQQADYQAALSNVATLQNQRDQYNQWLAQKQAEEEAARKAAEEAARQAAGAAQEAANNSAGPVFATCDDARAAGRGPIPRDDPAYRSELDPNNNGMACDGGGSSSSSSQASTEPYY